MHAVWVPVKGWLGLVHYELRINGVTVMSARRARLAEVPYTEPKVESTVYWTPDNEVDVVYKPLDLEGVPIADPNPLKG